MEASVAGQAGQAGQGDAGNGNGQGEAADAASQGPDIGALAEQLGSLNAGQEEMRQFLQSQPWQPQEQQAEETGQPDLDLAFLDPGDPEFNPEQMAQRLGGLIDQAAQQRADAAVDPLRQEVQEMRDEREWQSIADEFPELVDDEDVAKGAFQVADQLAKHNGHPELATKPWFVRMAYITAKAMEAANEEGAESPSAAHLEGGGGAAPAGSQVDPMTQVFGGGEGTPLGRRALPY